MKYFMVITVSSFFETGLERFRKKEEGTILVVAKCFDANVL